MIWWGARRETLDEDDMRGTFFPRRKQMPHNAAEGEGLTLAPPAEMLAAKNEMSMVFSVNYLL